MKFKFSDSIKASEISIAFKVVRYVDPTRYSSQLQTFWEESCTLKKEKKYVAAHNDFFGPDNLYRKISLSRQSKNPLVSCCLISMIQHGALIYFLDFDKLKGDISVDYSFGQKFTKMNGKKITLSQKDIVLSDGISAFCSIKEGSAYRCKVNAQTQTIFLIAFTPPKLPKVNAQKAVVDAAEYIERFCRTIEDQTKFKVTPWEVEGKLEYTRLIKEFGTEPIDDELKDRFPKPIHLFLRRGLFFSHRDLDILFDLFENGYSFSIATGRGPSGEMHLGHLIPFIFSKWLQEKFDVKIYIQITDDEKYFVKNLSYESVEKSAYENILDIIAVGFNPEKTFIFRDLEFTNLYKMAAKIAKYITFSTAKSVFGLTAHHNLGWIFFPVMQATHLLMAQFIHGKHPVLVPMAIDQDNYCRIARDIAPKFDFFKPSAIHSKFFPSLEGPSGKMSSSEERSAVFLSDNEDLVKQKIFRFAFTGGRESKSAHKKYGGNPAICVVYQWLYFLFEQDDSKLAERETLCKNGDTLCGECKHYLIEKIQKFLANHRHCRNQYKSKIDKFMLRNEDYQS
jgi:tryptophanyl-tRNA synthetase